MCYLFHIFYQHILNCLRTNILVCGIFSQDHYSVQRCYKEACPNIIFAQMLVRTMLLDGYMCKSLPSLHQHTQQTHHPRSWPTHSRPCRFQHRGRLARVLAVSTAAADSFVRAGLQRRCRPSPDAPAYKNCGGSPVSDFSFTIRCHQLHGGLFPA